MVDFVEIYKVSARKATIEAAKRIINSDKVFRSYSDLNFGVTFLEHRVCLLQCTPVVHYHLKAVGLLSVPQTYYMFVFRKKNYLYV